MEEWGRFEPVTVKKWPGEHTINVPMPHVDDTGAGALNDQIVAALVDKMLENGYSEADCGKFLGGNMYRVMKKVWI